MGKIEMAKVERQDPIHIEEVLRLNKFLALAGVGSRRKNDELILSGSVRVNGKTVRQLGIKVNPLHDRVMVNEQVVQLAQKYLYILLNKPKDCITTVSDERGRTTVMDYVKVKERVYPVGRLDRKTTGALLLTNEGELAHALTHPKFGLEKTYHVRVDRTVDDNDLRRLRVGVRIEDGKARASRVATVPGTRRTEIMVSVHEGRNRLVRRMFEALGYEIKKLDRISFGGLTTAGLARGKWRYLSRNEVVYLRGRVGLG